MKFHSLLSLSASAVSKTANILTLEPKLQSQYLPINMTFTPLISEELRWTGADIGASIPISGNMSIWLYGDTTNGWLEGTGISNYKRKDLGSWARNTISVVKNGKVESVHAKALQNCPRENQTCADSLFQPVNYHRHKNLYWGFDGIYLEHVDTLFVVGATIYAQNDMYPTGNLLMKVVNPASTSPDQWDYKRIPMTQTNMTGLGRGILEKDGQVYIFGDKGIFDGMVSRISVDDFVSDKWENLEYLRKNNTWSSGEPKTTQDLATIKTIILQSSESSVIYSEHFKKFIRFFTNISSGLIMYTADSIEGAWEKTDIGSVGAPYTDMKKDLFCYAPKIHQELSKDPTRLVMSVNCQGNDISDLFTYGGLYIPIFYTVDLSNLL